MIYLYYFQCNFFPYFYHSYYFTHFNKNKQLNNLKTELMNEIQSLKFVAKLFLYLCWTLLSGGVEFLWITFELTVSYHSSSTYCRQWPIEFKLRLMNKKEAILSQSSQQWDLQLRLSAWLSNTIRWVLYLMHGGRVACARVSNTIRWVLYLMHGGRVACARVSNTIRWVLYLMHGGWVACARVSNTIRWVLYLMHGGWVACARVSNTIRWVLYLMHGGRVACARVVLLSWVHCRVHMHSVRIV